MTSLRICQKCYTALSCIRQKQEQVIQICGRVFQNYTRTCHIRNSIARFNSTSSSEPPNVHTTIDQDEHHKFTKLASQWWDEKGDFCALHSMNRLRIPLICDALVDVSGSGPKTLPLRDKLILDVGSGGGILTEPLARLGATVIGIDMVEENIHIAQTHISQDPEIMGRVKYIHGAVEDLVLTEEGKFDAVVASEVVEHVSDVDMFISSCCKLIKPGGCFFLTTLNRTNLSYWLAVFGAEQLLRVVPPGTHDWNKFIPPEDLQLYLEQNGMTVRLLHGMCYNPVINRWSWMSNANVNYAMYAVKSTKTLHTKDTVEQTDY